MITFDLRRYRQVLMKHYPDLTLDRKSMRTLIYKSAVYVLEEESRSNINHVSRHTFFKQCSELFPKGYRTVYVERVISTLIEEIHSEFVFNGLLMPYDGFYDHRYNTETEEIEVIPMHRGEVDYIVKLCSRNPEEGVYERMELKHFHSIHCLESLKDWLEEEDQARLKPIPREFFELIDEFSRSTGWDK